MEDAEDIRVNTDVAPLRALTTTQYERVLIENIDIRVRT